jgi:hypothetical protein
MNDLAPLARLIDALRPWLGDLVIVGGWAHRLWRLHPRAGTPKYLPLQTLDADVALSAESPLRGDIGDALRNAGFRQEFVGEHAPPATHYRLGDEEQGFYAEFLAPLRGSGRKRDGTADATVAKAGITAQKLRHLEILLMRPWTVPFDPREGAPIAIPADVRVANPVCFIAQKLLIQHDRSPDKQAQDALYIHDTLELFGGELESLRTEWRERLRPMIGTRASKIERLARERFGTVTDVIRTAVRMPKDRALTPERFQAACSYGLQEIFGSE